jgi:hypothetical protein
MHINEGYPGLSETLQINNNKHLSPISSEATMSMNRLFFNLIFIGFVVFIVSQNPTSNNQILNSADAERYFTVETARGYIVIDREYEYTYLYRLFSIYTFCIALKIN